MTEAERIAIRVKYYDGTPCWCQECTDRRIEAAADRSKEIPHGEIHPPQAGT